MRINLILFLFSVFQLICLSYSTCDVNTIFSYQDCIFDQDSQNDSFLKGIKELENYEWDNDSKTADIWLNDSWRLKIIRGGCDHFTMAASFSYEGKLDIEKDKEIIIGKIIWITSLLDDFHGKKIKKIIQNDQLVISKRDSYNYYGNFMDDQLYELYYFEFSNEENTFFEIGYYFN